MFSESSSPFFSLVLAKDMSCVTFVSVEVDSVEYAVSTGIKVTLFQFSDKVFPFAIASFLMLFIMEINRDILLNV